MYLYIRYKCWGTTCTSTSFMPTQARHEKTAFGGAVPPVGAQSPSSHRKPLRPHYHHLSQTSDGRDGYSCSAGHTVTEPHPIPSVTSGACFCTFKNLLHPSHFLHPSAFLSLCYSTLQKIHDWNQATTQLNITNHQVKIIRPLLPQITQNTHYVILPSLGICPAWNCPEKTPVSRNDIKLLECLFQVQVDKAIHKLINSPRWAERFLMKPKQ